MVESSSMSVVMNHAPSITAASVISSIATSTVSAKPSSHSENPVQEEISLAWALLILTSLLVVILMTSYYLQINRIRILHESVISIFLGIVVGLIIRFGSPAIQGIVAFDHRYFFNLILPPIILNSGYDMKKKSFFRYIGSIMTFALLGTFISTLIIGVLVYILVLTGMHRLNMTMMDCLVFGAILSSTDPIAVLSLFHQMKVDPKLYAIIFGESILNDSVAIVLFSTLGQFNGKEFSIGNLFSGIFTFFGVFLGSILCGVLVSLFIALLLKYSHIYKFPSLESCLVILLAYSSYLLSNGLQLSGIVSLLFCGIILKHYAYDNMSKRSRRATKHMFRVLSQLSENFVFIYLGVTLFTNQDDLYLPGLIIFTLIFIVLARYASVVSLAKLINLLNRKLYPNNPEIIPRNHQLMLWWAGLRGAIAFALSFDVSGPAAQAIRTTTLVVCVISVIVLGGTTPRVIVELGIKTGVVGNGGSGSGKRKKTSPNMGNNHNNNSSSSISSLADMNGGGNNGDDTDSSDCDSIKDWTDSGLLDGGATAQQRQQHCHPLQNEYLGLRDEEEEERGGGGGWFANNIQYRNDEIEPSPSRLSFNSSINGMRDSINALLGHAARIREEDLQHWFISFDNQYLKPVFTRVKRKDLSSSIQSSTIRNGQFSGHSTPVSTTRFPRSAAINGTSSLIRNGTSYSKLVENDVIPMDVYTASQQSQFNAIPPPSRITSAISEAPISSSKILHNDDNDKFEERISLFAIQGDKSIGTISLDNSITGSTSNAIMDAVESDDDDDVR